MTEYRWPICDRCRKEATSGNHHYLELDKYRYDTDEEYLLCEDCFLILKELLKIYLPNMLR